MGRTVRTASMLISEESSRWRDFRAALRQRDREAFDRLTARSRRHFSAISNSGIIDPFEAVALSILLEVEKRLEALERDRKGDEEQSGNVTEPAKTAAVN